MPEKQYFVRVRGKVTGPFATQQLRSLRDRGQFRQFHEVSEDRQNWQSASSLTELFAGSADLEQHITATPQPPALGSGSNKPVLATNWLYVDAHGKQQGPVPEHQLLSLWQSGAITDATLVWRDGQAEWAPIASPALGLANAKNVQRFQGAGSGSRRWFLVASLFLIVLALGAGGAVVLIKTEKSVSKSITEIVQNASGSQTIASAGDEKSLAQAVGFVVCGAHVVAPDGAVGDGAFSTGSCFAISPDGHVVTNKHVVEKSQNLKNARLLLKKMQDDLLLDVKPTVWVFFGKEKFVADILHISDDYDMAILKVDRKGVPFFRLSRVDRQPRGKKVIACGFPGASSTPLSAEETVRQMSRESKHAKIETLFKPRDFEFVMTDGSVSRMLTEDGSDRQWVQHNASISPGSSGGPLLDEYGTVVGINTLVHKLAPGTFWSLATPQLKTEIEKYVSGAAWD